MTYCILYVVGDFIDDQSFLNQSDILREIDFLKIEFLFCALLFDLYKW